MIADAIRGLPERGADRLLGKLVSEAEVLELLAVATSPGPWYPRDDHDGDIVDGSGTLIATVYPDPSYDRSVERATIIAAVNVAKAGRS